VTDQTCRTTTSSALYGLFLLGLATILADCLLTGLSNVRLDGPPADPDGACLYHVMEDHRPIRTLFLSAPEAFSSILAKAGVITGAAGPGQGGLVPCNRTVRFSSDQARNSVEKIPAHLLLVAAQRVDINEADELDLIALPGIGPKLAERIIGLRESRGGFSCISDLRGVPGIGKKKFAAIEPFVEVRSSGLGDRLQDIQAP
jgi:competence ComEA-like helix-hairpin-helix protein